MLEHPKQRETIAGNASLNITYYTDPLCCWSWAFEPQWRRFLYVLGDQVNYRYRMAGLIPGWNEFHDRENSISRPLQMGPMWMHAAAVSGMPIVHQLWATDPPLSSYPACIAVKAAEMQSSAISELYLRLLREAVMQRGINISKKNALTDVAKRLEKLHAEFDIHRWETDRNNDNAMNAFRDDLTELQKNKITRFPTLVLKYSDKPAVIFSGYRPYDSLMNVLKIVQFPLESLTQKSKEGFKNFWPYFTERELKEIPG